jgi:hypothetical protein
MNRIITCTFAFAITLGGLTACAVNKPSKQTVADQDAGKLSKDGSTAIRDVSLARLAIFNGQTAQAKTYTNEAQTALEKAKSDDTVFTKAEADLKAPPGVTQPGAGATASTTPTTWIPVNGSMTLGEDYIDTPEKSAGVTKANEQLKKGDHQQAVETLKLANIDVSFVMEVAPLDKTTSGINKAAQLIDAGKYYEANQALKAVEDGLRFDVTNVDSTPKKVADETSKPATAPTVAKK